jgi:hypothetical protein
MKKILYLFLLGFILPTAPIFADSSGEQDDESISDIKQTYNRKSDYERSINLCDSTGTIIQCAHPDTLGNFYFSELIPGKYTIKVINQNGFQSEVYYIECVNGEINNNLSYVLKPQYLVHANNSVETYSCETKSNLNLSLSPNPLPNKSDIQFTTNKEANVLIVINNDQGNKVRVIPVGNMQSGVQTVTLDTSGLLGTYQIVAQAGKQQSTCTIKLRK